MRHLITHHAAGAGLLLMAGLVLTGCTQATNESAPVEASATPIQESTPSPSPTEFIPASTAGPAQNVPVPEMPDAIHEPTQEGAEAALYYWWDAYHYGLLTGDPKYLESVVGAVDCLHCDHAIKNAASVNANGAWYQFHPFEVEIIESRFDPATEQATIDFFVTEQPGKVFHTSAPGEFHQTMTEEYTQKWYSSFSYDDLAKQWLVSSLTLEVDE